MKYFFYCIICFALLINCNSEDDCPIEEEENLCLTKDLGIGIENQDPFYSTPTPSTFLSATRRWLWENINGNLKVFSQGEVSDEAVEYRVFEFSFNENGCITPVLFSKFSIEGSVVLNTTTNEYDYLEYIYNYSEDTFTVQVEEYKENEFLKASVICNSNPNLSKNIFVELVSDNNREIPN
jgi:hypothetical protein